MKNALLILLITLSFSSFAQQEKYVDTIYVEIDSASIDKQSNTFDYILIVRLGGKTQTIYRIKNQDYSIEFVYNFSFSDAKKSYICYNVGDLPTGIVWSYIFDKKAKQVYFTDAYDLQAVGDALIKNSINFQKNIAFVESGIKKKKYEVKLHLLSIK